MLILGPLGFATPWVLAALAALPVLWIILRAMPPAPKRLIFPAVTLLLGLRDRDAQAQRTPWWLLLLRIVAMAALIAAMAGPVWRPVAGQGAGRGPMLVIVDSGWAAARDWPRRVSRATQALEAAQDAGRPVALLLADGQAEAGPLVFATGTELAARMRAASPAPWTSRYPGDPAAALSLVPEGGLETLWISDGLDHPLRAEWLAELSARGAVHVVPPGGAISSLQVQTGDEPGLVLQQIAGAGAPAILALGPDPQGIERELARLVPGAPGEAGGVTRYPVAIDLQPELRNRISRYQIEGEASAGAVVLGDDALRRRKVAIVGGGDQISEGQILLSQAHYIRRALAPVADLIEGDLGDVLRAAPDVIILIDQVDMPENEPLSDWVRDGGLLIRFAGPRMAAAERLDPDPLLPVRLRPGGRDMGGSLSWGDPRGIAPFDPEGPFAGLEPPAEVDIRAQLMADPGPELAARTIARLSDETPLVTRDRLGEGQVVLFHTTANAEWSSLPLSGLFIDMLDRLMKSAHAAPVETAGDAEQAPFWTPEIVLDGFGRLQGPGDLAPVAMADLAAGAGPGQPPGLWRAAEQRRALNAGSDLHPATWPGAAIETEGTAAGIPLRDGLLAAVALLLALDVLASAWVARGRRATA